MLYDLIMPIPERSSPSFATVEASSPMLPDRREEARRRLIVALDAPTTAAALELVDRVEGQCQWFKVGLELFAAAGPAVLEPLAARGHSVFLDLKLHDIPNTVAGAVRSAAAHGVQMLTLHALGGPAMLAAAHAALEGLPSPPELLAVTVLTSMDSEQLQAVAIHRAPAEQAELLARMGLAAGIRGFVCSPQEVHSLRALTGPSGVLVVPGIRPAGASVGDQKRVATPAEAIQAGASYLVVGRPITQAPNPAEAAAAILREIADGLIAQP
ncbi:MAG TPA: orotidine-5'-phosphate decarboxylase [Terracidiphilus sp.]